jgi:hypothetical protein
MSVRVKRCGVLMLSCMLAVFSGALLVWSLQ